MREENIIVRKSTYIVLGIDKEEYEKPQDVKTKWNDKFKHI